MKKNLNRFSLFSVLYSNGYLKQNSPIHDINGKGPDGCKSNRFFKAVYHVYENLFIGSL